MESIVLVTQELNKLFDELNKIKFSNNLEKPIIVVQSDKRAKAYGWCSLKKVWVENEQEKYEITITAEFLNRPYEEICGTMLHEMVHLYNIQNEIKDNSNNGIYHNKKFKESAETFGLVVDKSEKYGWAITKLNQQSIDLVNKFDINKDVFKLYKKVFKKEEKEDKTKSWGYECPKCGTKFTYRKKLNLICGDCKTAFMVEEKGKE